MDLKGVHLGETASKIIEDNLRKPRPATKEMKEHIKRSMELNKKINKHKK